MKYVAVLSGAVMLSAVWIAIFYSSWIVHENQDKIDRLDVSVGRRDEANDHNQCTLDYTHHNAIDNKIASAGTPCSAPALNVLQPNVSTGAMVVTTDGLLTHDTVHQQFVKHSGTNYASRFEFGSFTGARVKNVKGMCKHPISNEFFFVSDSTFRRKDPTSGAIDVIVGTAGAPGQSGATGITASTRLLNRPSSCTFDKVGNAYIATHEGIVKLAVPGSYTAAAWKAVTSTLVAITTSGVSQTYAESVLYFDFDSADHGYMNDTDDALVFDRVVVDGDNYVREQILLVNVSSAPSSHAVVIHGGNKVTAMPAVATARSASATSGLADCHNLVVDPTASTYGFLMVCIDENGYSWVDRYRWTNLSDVTGTPGVTATVQKVTSFEYLTYPVACASTVAGDASQCGLTYMTHVAPLASGAMYITGRYHEPASVKADGLVSGATRDLPLGVWYLDSDNGTDTSTQNITYMGGAAELYGTKAPYGPFLSDSDLEINNIQFLGSDAITLWLSTDDAIYDWNITDKVLELNIGAPGHAQTLDATTSTNECAHVYAMANCKTDSLNYALVACSDGLHSTIKKLVAGTTTFTDVAGGNTYNAGTVPVSNTTTIATSATLGVIRGIVIDTESATCDALLLDDTFGHIISFVGTTVQVIGNTGGTKAIQSQTSLADVTFSSGGDMCHTPGSKFFYFSDPRENVVICVGNETATTNGWNKYSQVTRLAGTGREGQTVSSGHALLTDLNKPTALGCQADGTVLIFNSGDHKILSYDPKSKHIHVRHDSSRSGGSLHSTHPFLQVQAMHVDSAGQTLVADYNHDALLESTTFSGACSRGVCVQCGTTSNPCPAMQESTEDNSFSAFIVIWIIFGSALILTVVGGTVMCRKMTGYSGIN